MARRLQNSKKAYRDHWAMRAKNDGYRSRAAYKLLEILEKFSIPLEGAKVLDLGAAPGSWSQVLAANIGKRGKVVSIDLQEMLPIKGAELLQGDVNVEKTRLKLHQLLNGVGVNAVFSDMAPNTTGQALVDVTRSHELASTALIISKRYLLPQGVFVVKVFQGSGFEGYVKMVREVFAWSKISKPRASRPTSKEVYIVAGGYSP